MLTRSLEFDYGDDFYEVPLPESDFKANFGAKFNESGENDVYWYNKPILLGKRKPTPFLVSDSFRGFDSLLLVGLVYGSYVLEF